MQIYGNHVYADEVIKAVDDLYEKWAAKNSSLFDAAAVRRIGAFFLTCNASLDTIAREGGYDALCDRVGSWFKPHARTKASVSALINDFKYSHPTNIFIKPVNGSADAYELAGVLGFVVSALGEDLSYVDPNKVDVKSGYWAVNDRHDYALPISYIRKRSITLDPPNFDITSAEPQAIDLPYDEPADELDRFLPHNVTYLADLIFRKAVRNVVLTAISCQDEAQACACALGLVDSGLTLRTADADCDSVCDDNAALERVGTAILTPTAFLEVKDGHYEAGYMPFPYFAVRDYIRGERHKFSTLPEVYQRLLTEDGRTIPEDEEFVEIWLPLKPVMYTSWDLVCCMFSQAWLKHKYGLTTPTSFRMDLMPVFVSMAHSLKDLLLQPNNVCAIRYPNGLTQINPLGYDPDTKTARFVSESAFPAELKGREIRITGHEHKGQDLVARNYSIAFTTVTSASLIGEALSNVDSGALSKDVQADGVKADPINLVSYTIQEEA